MYARFFFNHKHWKDESQNGNRVLKFSKISVYKFTAVAQKNLLVTISSLEPAWKFMQLSKLQVSISVKGWT